MELNPQCRKQAGSADAAQAQQGSANAKAAPAIP